MVRAPVVCLSHGGGPLPLLNDPDHKDIISSLKNRVPKILGLGTARQPRAIAVVTAHWQADTPSISSGKHHDLLYDYYGFPKETYKLKYDAPGSPEIAAEIAKAIESEGLIPNLDAKRGWDHGVFVPFLLIHPEANIPIVQVSILGSEDPASHFRIGAALGKLRDQNIAILGSGFASFHNLPVMFGIIRGAENSPKAEAVMLRNNAWNKAIEDIVVLEDRGERLARLEKWRQIPNANEMHPPHGGDHFMPLLVTAAAADNEKANYYKDRFLGMHMYTFFWGADPVA
uniref:Catechol dioxygenase 3 n=1 Tax=Endoconidiophora polonica TaxID=1580850 RepID=A0A173G4S5_9PEZI|nr:catechol dioxygenase 3 [Endoconidiophora polonica]